MILEARQVKEIKLVDARTQLFLTQKQLSDLTIEDGIRRVSSAVISNCENGLPIRRLSAYRLLDALNRKRKEKNLPPLQFAQIDWKIQGDGEGDEEEK